MENKGPKIDLARLRSKRHRSTPPMLGDRSINVDPRTQLISPPPEEILRRTEHASASKRKRNVLPATPVQITPNPKPRKQARASSAQIDSPTKPNADYLPPIPLSARRATLTARRRSATPIPPYEPPKDVFTPPREVYVAPPSSSTTTSKRKSTTKNRKRPSAITTTIKRELFDVDLDAPMPPPSPTDDPLLLSSSADPCTTPTRPRPVDPRIPDDLPPSSPIDEDVPSSVPQFDWTRHTHPEGSTDDSLMLVDPADADVAPLQFFDLQDLPEGSGGWSDSDDEVDEDNWDGQGEYTGKWKSVRVRTKADPPSSATRIRMEDWGRPISPFPRKIDKLKLVPEEEELDVLPAEDSTVVDVHEDMDVEDDEEEEQEVREMSLELEEENLDEEYQADMPEDEDESEEERQVREMSLEIEQDDDEDLLDDSAAQETISAIQDIPSAAKAFTSVPSSVPRISIDPAFLAVLNSSSGQAQEQGNSSLAVRASLSREGSRAPSVPREVSVAREVSRAPSTPREPSVEHEASVSRGVSRAPSIPSERSVTRERSVSRTLEPISFPVPAETQEDLGEVSDASGHTHDATGPTFGASSPSHQFNNAYSSGNQSADLSSPIQGFDTASTSHVSINPFDFSYVGDVSGDYMSATTTSDGPSSAVTHGLSVCGAAGLESASAPVDKLTKVSVQEPVNTNEVDVAQRDVDVHQYQDDSEDSPMLDVGASSERYNVYARSVGQERGVNYQPEYEQGYNDEVQYKHGKETRYAQANDEDDDESGSAGEEFGVVKIVSADPRAAARAAAILKQHDYDCYTKKTRPSDIKKRRGSHSTVDGLVKAVMRRDVVAAGVTSPGKARRYTAFEHRDEYSDDRRRSMGVVGERVYIPGSPATTLPELLAQAEKEVEAEHTRLSVAGLEARLAAFETPVRKNKAMKLVADSRTLDSRPKTLSGLRTEVRMRMEERSGEQGWTKDEWKLLDACFTDERLEAGVRLGMDGLGGDGLAPVEFVNVGDVVDRFVDALGGKEVLEKFGDAWSRDNLLQRALALQKKQRAGHVAPPTTPVTPRILDEGSASVGGLRRMPSMEVPDFTPLGRRAGPPRKQRPVLPSPAGRTAPFARDNLSASVGAGKRIPASLLAPRYSHLMEEAIAVSQASTPSLGTIQTTFSGEEQDTSLEESNTSLEGPDTSLDGPEDDTSQPFEEEDSQLDEESFEMQDQLPTTPARVERDTHPATLKNRVKGFLFSYLPTLSKTAPAAVRKPEGALRRPGLPLPPQGVLEKPRGPIATPVRAPLPKPKHPKEMVNLQPAPAPVRTSLIPRAAKPQRLVELHPLPPPPPIEAVHVPRPRRSSGGSVKDLVKGFEEMRAASVCTGNFKGLKSARSIGELRKPTRPAWKP